MTRAMEHCDDTVMKHCDPPPPTRGVRGAGWGGARRAREGREEETDQREREQPNQTSSITAPLHPILLHLAPEHIHLSALNALPLGFCWLSYSCKPLFLSLLFVTLSSRLPPVSLSPTLPPSPLSQIGRASCRERVSSPV